jgi:hypothetical protein
MRRLARGIGFPRRILRARVPPIYQLQIGRKTGRKNGGAKQFCGKAQRALPVLLRAETGNSG